MEALVAVWATELPQRQVVQILLSPIHGRTYGTIFMINWNAGNGKFTVFCSNVHPHVVRVLPHVMKLEVG
jgi:hypothetical protein